MTGFATAVVSFELYTALPVTVTFDDLGSATNIVYHFDDLTLNTLGSTANITLVGVY